MNKLILFFSVMTFVGCQSRNNLSKILERIREINEVQYEHVGIAGTKSQNYKNYLALRSRASTSTLLSLTDDTNAVVACYAGWALIDRSYPNLPAIFTKFVTNDRVLETFSGCNKMQVVLSNEFYHKYWNTIEESRRSKDQRLFLLDSIILYNYSNWLLTSRALENRVYPKSFNKRIEHLAFDKTNRDAISYLIKWERNQYQDKIKASLLEYLKETDFKNVGVTPYFDTVEELLRFNDEAVKTAILEKLKKDTHWKYQEGNFLSLLQKYGIQIKDIS